jgi:very-short-patch-repair endonuclease
MKHKTRFPYNKALVEKARYLRNNSTLSEILLWKYLKGKQMLGYDFDRQKPIDNFIVDFFCNELRLIIEIDGNSHDDKQEYDAYRQNKLENLGLEFLRFSDLQVKTDMFNVVRAIENWILEWQERSPTPSTSEEGDLPTPSPS